MAMRLNLDGILQNQLRNNPKPAFERLEKPALKLGGVDNYNPYFPDQSELKSRVHSMISDIHRNMKTTLPPRKAVPTIPAAIAEIQSPPSVTKSVGLKKGRRVKGGGVSGLSNSKSAVPLSQLKAKMGRQAQQVMRRGYSELGVKDFTNQRRIREVIMQKNVLENMLLQHKRLQRDRQTIALDIQRMRQDLDRIKTKLDTSLQALNSTRTLYNGFTKTKKNIAPIASTAGSTRVASPKKGANKPSNLTLKKQHSSISKRRVRV